MSVAQGLRDAFKYLYPDELPALQQLARSLPANPHVVNIGAGAGTSGLAFLESRPDLRLTTIDPQDLSSPFGCLEAERVEAEKAGVIERLTQICGRSQDVVRGWKTYVDMVFIDGDHSYEGCRDDIDFWGYWVKPGGLLLVHDYNKQLLAVDENGPHPMPWVGVNEAVDELLLNQCETVLYVSSLIAFRM